MKQKHEVRAICQIDNDFNMEIPALNFLQGHAKAGQYSSSAKGFKTLFSRYAAAARVNLTAELFHEVDKNEKIWQFIKGDLRIFCFFDNTDIVLTHGAIKKSNKVDSSEVDRVVRHKVNYFAN